MNADPRTERDAHAALADYAESRLPGDGVREGPAEGHPLRSDAHGAMTVLCIAVAAIVLLVLVLSLIMRGASAASARASAAQPVECAKPSSRGVTT